MKRHLFLLLGLTACVAFVLGLVAAGSRSIGDTRTFLAKPARTDTPALVVSVASPAGAAANEATSLDFSVVAAKLNGAVVNIDAATRAAERGAAPRRMQRNYRDDGTGPREGAGSGFVIDPAGYILTNNHVIDGADRVTVTLGDGRVVRATVVGTDPAIDVALLKIPAGGLQAAVLGNSDGLRVGEWVCAIGNPAGYVHSVTVGVVSFLGRKLSDPGLDSFIQTDAAITFGNSGGPLINSRGEVVGITTAISSEASNIGFAIPISQVMGVLAQMKEDGRVSRGYLAVSLTTATPDLRKSLRLTTNGAVVEDVTPDTPAERAGLRPYDVITSIDGRAVRTDDDVLRYVSSQPPGAATELSVWRDGATQSMRVRLTERPLPRSARPLSSGLRVSAPVNPEQVRLGLTVKDIDAATAGKLTLSDSVAGVLVTEVDPAGPARLAGMRTGHIVLEVNRRRVMSAAEFRAAIAGLRAGETAALFVYDRRSDQRSLYSVGVDPQ
jgi:serine protease Do